MPRDRRGKPRCAAPRCHEAHEAALAASGGALQQSWQPAAAGREKHLLFIETVFNIALPVQGVRVRKVLTGDDIFDIRCDMHPWIRVWLFVSPSPHYAVIREPTTLGFTGIAPGEFILHVWQPDRPESIRSVNLRAGETRHLRLR